MRDDEGRRRRELEAAAPTEWGQGVDSKGHSPHNPKLSCSVVVPLQHSDKANDTFNNSTAGEGLGKWKPCQGQDEQGKDGMHREGRFEQERREGLRACYWEGPSELPERRSSSSAPRRDSA